MGRKNWILKKTCEDLLKKTLEINTWICATDLGVTQYYYLAAVYFHNPGPV